MLWPVGWPWSGTLWSVVWLWSAGGWVRSLSERIGPADIAGGSLQGSVPDPVGTRPTATALAPPATPVAAVRPPRPTARLTAWPIFRAPFGASSEPRGPADKLTGGSFAAGAGLGTTLPWTEVAVRGGDDVFDRAGG